VQLGSVPGWLGRIRRTLLGSAGSLQGFLKSFLGIAKSILESARPLLEFWATPTASSRILSGNLELLCEGSQIWFWFRGYSNGVTPTPIPDHPRPK